MLGLKYQVVCLLPINDLFGLGYQENFTYSSLAHLSGVRGK